MGKNKESEDLYGPEITCPCCTKCYLRADLLKHGMEVCWFGGPFTGYQDMRNKDGKTVHQM